MSAELPDRDLTREEVVSEIARLAALDSRRGIDYWFDGELTEALREIAISGGAAGKRPPTAAVSPSREAPTSPKTVSTPLEMVTPPQAARPAAGTKAMDVPPTATGQPDSPARTSKVPSWGAPPLAAGRDEGWSERLATLGRKAADCTLCDLCRTRTQVVFGVGSAAVPLVFVGEAPGAEEDREGYPFVGRAGQLLDKIIRAIGLERDEIYICNVLKCRPPGNRNPAPAEIAACTPFLEEQLAILRPKVICSLGLFASQFLTGTDLPIGKLRGRIFDYHGTPLIPTYHPAALLRNPGYKAAVWDDVQLVRRTLDR